jgi:uncharacterized protein YwgA/O-acetyl-ADP-ribose deacetylase (regulator of RNase III)
MTSVHVHVGDLFKSKAQTWVNTVNTVGVMGKGVALGFKQRFPDMYADYLRRCERREVRLGEPYVFRSASLPWIINFPTKEHWRSVSRLTDIVAGLEYLEKHVREWQVTSMAVPPLGCGQGGLEWSVVGPTLFRHLKRLDVPVELYAPHGTPEDQLALNFLDRPPNVTIWASQDRISEGALVLVEVVARIAKEPYHWPVGHVRFQKLAYFAKRAGVPLELNFERGSYGPYSKQVKPLLSHLVNNGLLIEAGRGRMLAIRPGPTYPDAQRIHGSYIAAWEAQIERLVDLFTRIPTTNQAELVATVDYVAQILAAQGRVSEHDVFEAVREWKPTKSWTEDSIAVAVRYLGMLGWLKVEPSIDLPVSEAAGVA